MPPHRLLHIFVHPCASSGKLADGNLKSPVRGIRGKVQNIPSGRSQQLLRDVGCVGSGRVVVQ